MLLMKEIQKVLGRKSSHETSQKQEENESETESSG